MSGVHMATPVAMVAVTPSGGAAAQAGQPESASA